MTEVALHTEALGKRYGQTWALQDCSLELPAGRIAALVGPNGAGKSTLLHLAVGLLRPDTGQVRVFGRDPREDPDARADLGFVAQDTPLYPDFTATELITMGRRLNPRGWDDSIARDRLTRLGLPLDKRVGRLSGGQRAQVALALALAKRPRLLLLDEPVAALDPLARHEFMQALMGAVGEYGTTVLLSSHLLNDLERVCDHLVLLHTSQVRLSAPVDDLLASHCRLVGPRIPDGAAVPGVAEVVRASHTERQSTLLVRTDGPVDESRWTVHEVTLEDLVLAHLGASAGPTAGPTAGPSAGPTASEVAA
ncbi:ABC transporter ATP-binding protein [Streptomyces sp. NRRL S-495]|uniref:ABC transporter ATP-binding protein n=1 Tax=Streptomyces sp. NRRL S-495 TaxID=1609133 RepID=UPI0005F98C73|nr:ABC transporter ATP-binding protein [Streptomyces sp. NRRL S-495]KJY39847.1 ABC transporter ATP-binding protein [Streptomyces sp. NRRL S-495]